MKTKHHLQKLACIALACSFPLFAHAKIKLETQSQFCPDFTTVATPDSSTLFMSFANDKMLIRAFNNATGFYIQLVATDDPTQQKLLFNGLTVYIDPTGKGKDRYAVIFPSLMSLRQQSGPGGLTPSMDQPQIQPNQGGQGQDDQNQSRGPRRPDPTQQVQQINLKGALFDIDGDSRAVGIEWVKLTTTSNHKICYNIKLPYSIFNLKNSATGLLSIGLLSEFSLPQGMQSGSGGGMGGPGGGMGGPGGGMGGPGGGMGGPGGGMGGPGGGMGGLGGGMDQSTSGSKSTSSEMGKPIKGWIQVKLESTH
ncbi:MAG: hypothetical protein H6Q17_1984 [Bacteroidetes bacterium]|nr:hypothetical protein [Bacteroidota bacterium]